jgi:hypothetical protein
MEITCEGYMALMAELMKPGAAKDGEEGLESPVNYVSSRRADGTVTSIVKSIEVYEKKLRDCLPPAGGEYWNGGFLQKIQPMPLFLRGVP